VEFVHLLKSPKAYHSLKQEIKLFSVYQRWAGPQFVPQCAFPQLAQQGNLLRMCALIHRQLTAEKRLRTKKYSCGPYFHYAQYTVEDSKTFYPLINS
jgi:hypothetical protein